MKNIEKRLASILADRRTRLMEITRFERVITVVAFCLLAIAPFDRLVYVGVAGAAGAFYLARKVRGRMDRERVKVASLEVVANTFVPLALVDPGRGGDRRHPLLLVPGLDDVARPAAYDRFFTFGVWAGTAALAMVVVGAAGLAVTASTTKSAAPASFRWTFLEESLSQSDLAAPSAIPEGWAIEIHAAATGGRALVKKASAPEDEPLPAVLVAESRGRSRSARDLRAVTRCMVERDTRGSACGLVVRFVDEKNHRAIRVDALAKTVEIVAVEGGRTRVIASAPVAVAPDQWHEVAAVAIGGRIDVSINGRHALTGADVPFNAQSGPALVGVWAHARGAVYFDELSIESRRPNI